MVGQQKMQGAPPGLRVMSEVRLSKQTLISVVDDDQSFRDSIRRLLKSLGYAVSVFPSAADFLAFPAFDETDCLVADVHMPERSGIGLYKHLIDAGHAIPTILVTAYPDEGIKQRMLALGVVCYLSKPLEEAQLIRCLGSVFRHGKAS